MLIDPYTHASAFSLPLVSYPLPTPPTPSITKFTHFMRDNKVIRFIVSRIFSSTANFHFTTTPWFDEKRESHLVWIAFSSCHTKYLWKKNALWLNENAIFHVRAHSAHTSKWGFFWYVSSYNLNLESLLPMRGKFIFRQKHKSVHHSSGNKGYVKAKNQRLMKQ